MQWRTCSLLAAAASVGNTVCSFFSFCWEQEASEIFQSSLIGALSCAASVFCPLCGLSPPAQGSLTEVDPSPALKFSTDTTVWQPLREYDTGRNQQVRREHQHMFGTEGHVFAANAQYSMQVTAIRANVWVIWLIQGSLREQGCRQLGTANQTPE